jgi:hypothetical protein
MSVELGLSVILICIILFYKERNYLTLGNLNIYIVRGGEWKVKTGEWRGLWVEIDASWYVWDQLCKLIDHLCYTICFVAAMANKKTEAVGLYLLLFIWIEESESKMK